MVPGENNPPAAAAAAAATAAGFEAGVAGFEAGAVAPPPGAAATSTAYSSFYRHSVNFSGRTFYLLCSSLGKSLITLLISTKYNRAGLLRLT